MTDLNSVFFALGDETRRAILGELKDGEKPLSVLAQPFDMSQTAVTRHVRVLEDAGLVTIEKRGRVRHCALTAGPMGDVTSWLEDYRPFWADRLDALEKAVRESADE